MNAPRTWTIYVCAECGHFSTESDDHCYCLPDGLDAVSVVEAPVEDGTGDSGALVEGVEKESHLDKSVTGEADRLAEAVAALEDLMDVQLDFPTDLTPNPGYFKAFDNAAAVLCRLEAASRTQATGDE